MIVTKKGLLEHFSLSILSKKVKQRTKLSSLFRRIRNSEFLENLSSRRGGSRLGRQGGRRERRREKASETQHGNKIDAEEVNYRGSSLWTFYGIYGEWRGTGERKREREREER